MRARETWLSYENNEDIGQMTNRGDSRKYEDSFKVLSELNIAQVHSWVAPWRRCDQSVPECSERAASSHLMTDWIPNCSMVEPGDGDVGPADLSIGVVLRRGGEVVDQDDLHGLRRGGHK